jgi:hypothetical protein
MPGPALRIHPGFDPILDSPTLDALLAPHAATFPRHTDFLGYRSHCLRMLNVVLALSKEEPDRREKVEVALAFHDLALFPDRTLAYLDGAVALAEAHLRGIDRTDWIEPVTLMIRNHHKVRRYTGPQANLVEPFRCADWIDVSFRVLNFGIDRAWLRALHAQLPLHSFYPRTLVPLIARYMARHPLRPLPNFRW